MGTLTKFPSVFVEPLEHVYTSSIPAIDSTFFGTRAATIPAPRGAGMSLTITLPHFPVTLVGTVCGAPILLPQYPLLTGTTDILAKIIAPLIAVATYIIRNSSLGAATSHQANTALGSWSVYTDRWVGLLWETHTVYETYIVARHFIHSALMLTYTVICFRKMSCIASQPLYWLYVSVCFQDYKL